MSELPDDWRAWRAQEDLERYDERFGRLAESGRNPHGEAGLVASYAPATVLDAGCGTGRVAIELARRGIAVLGVDADPDMITAARAEAPELGWDTADLADLDRPERFDVVVLVGNDVPYVAPERRERAVAACMAHLVPGGRVIAGFRLRPGWPTPNDYERWCTAGGAMPEGRFATWERARTPVADYVVAVHRVAG